MLCIQVGQLIFGLEHPDISVASRWNEEKVNNVS